MSTNVNNARLQTTVHVRQDILGRVSTKLVVVMTTPRTSRREDTMQEVFRRANFFFKNINQVINNNNNPVYVAKKVIRVHMSANS